jgi:3-methyladenine DNA glycosylase AlkD
MTLIEDLLTLANPEKTKDLMRFFKTGKGQYGEGDEFAGITIPQIRNTIKKYPDLGFDELQTLLDSRTHEFRMAALLILVNQFKKAKPEKRKEIFNFYLKNIEKINNWDLVDCSCHYIVGAYLFDKDRSILDEMTKADHLWTQRIAIVSTWYFINQRQFEDTLRISEILLPHKHDLIHKAIGWMLREAWKKGGNIEIEAFLEKNIRQIPRTTLRYSIEKMSDERKQYFMKL